MFLADCMEGIDGHQIGKGYPLVIVILYGLLFALAIFFYERSVQNIIPLVMWFGYKFNIGLNWKLFMTAIILIFPYILISLWSFRVFSLGRDARHVVFMRYPVSILFATICFYKFFYIFWKADRKLAINTEENLGNIMHAATSDQLYLIVFFFMPFLVGSILGVIKRNRSIQYS